MANDPFIKFIHEDLGKERFLQVLFAMSEAGKKTESLTHNDVHVFNMLVEKTTKRKDQSGMAEFGELGSFYFCDWEQACAGPNGRDIGKFMNFPLVASFHHAARGNGAAAKHIVDSILDTFWVAYSTSLVEKATRKTMTTMMEQDGTFPPPVDLAKTRLDVVLTDPHVVIDRSRSVSNDIFSL